MLSRAQWKYGMISAVLFTIAACLDPIEFPDVEAEDLVVIEGQFTPSKRVHTVRISRTSAFGKKVFRGVENAGVSILHGDLQEVFLEVSPGIYALEGHTVRGQPGEKYVLEVKMPNGKVFRSLEDAMPMVQQADSAYFHFEREVFVNPSGRDRFANVLNIYIDTHLKERDLYLRWYVDELYSFPEETCGGLDIPLTCYIPLEGNPQNISLYNNRELGLDKITGLKVGSKNSFPAVEFKGPHYFTVFQHVITQNAYAYWQKVVDVVNQSGTVFDKPPARITGNMYNVQNPDERVLGYFELAAIDTVRTVVLPSEYQEALNRSPHCNTFFRAQWGPECCNCLRILNATTERPGWLK